MALAADPTGLLSAGFSAIKHSQWVSGAEFSSAALKMPGLTEAQEIIALNNLCIAMGNLPDKGKALDVCDKAVEAAPERWSGYSNRGYLKLSMGLASAAATDFAQAKLLNPDQYLSDLATRTPMEMPQNYFLAMRPLQETGVQQAEMK